jgi:hypothetical protein
MFCDNVDFTGSAIPSPQMVLDGQLIIGDTGGNPKINTLTAGAGVTITNGPGTIAISTNGSNDLHTAKFIVSAEGTNGTGANYTTITSAIAAAQGTGLPSTIFIMPGTYTESFILPANINLTAFTCDALTPNVTIIGKITCSDAGSRTISGIRLQTNGDFFLVVSGTLATDVNITNCYLNCTNNTGFSHTVSNASSDLNITYCVGDILTTGITLFSCSSSGMLRIDYSRINNTGGTSTASTNSAADFRTRHSIFFFPISISSTGNITSLFVDIETQNQNATSLALTGSGTSAVKFSNYASGSASAVSVGAGVTLEMADSVVASSNTNVITGAGTLLYTNLAMPNSSVMNVTTQTPAYTQLGKYKASGQPAFFAYNTTNPQNVTGDGTAYTPVVFDTELYDQNSNFSSNTFTAPVTGKYQFSVSILAQNATAPMSRGVTLITTSQNYNMCNDGASFAGNNALSFSICVNMTAGDTATVSVVFGGGAKVVDIYGAVGDPRTFFSGFLVC